MAETPVPVPASQILAALDEQICLTLLAHQSVTSRAIDAQAMLDQQLQRQRDLTKSWQIRAHVAMQEDLSESDRQSYEATLDDSRKADQLEEALTRQKVATATLKELLFDLENLVLTMTVATRLFNSLTTLDIDVALDSSSENRFDLRQLDCSFGELFETFADIASVRSGSTQAPANTYSVDELPLLQDRAEQINNTVSNLIGHFDRTDAVFQQQYKTSLVQKALALEISDLKDWLTRNDQVIKDLEKCTTKQREDLVLWQARTELAYTKNNESLATKAWQRKEQYGAALSKLESALVAQVEAGALARQRLHKAG